jgi:hypothetical protein
MVSALSIGTSRDARPQLAAVFRMAVKRYGRNPALGPPPREIVWKIFVKASETRSSGSNVPVNDLATASPAR